MLAIEHVVRFQIAHGFRSDRHGVSSNAETGIDYEVCPERDFPGETQLLFVRRNRAQTKGPRRGMS
jgi:hypothetical protein